MTAIAREALDAYESALFDYILEESERRRIIHAAILKLIEESKPPRENKPALDKTLWRPLKRRRV